MSGIGNFFQKIDFKKAALTVSFFIFPILFIYIGWSFLKRIYKNSSNGRVFLKQSRRIFEMMNDDDREVLLLLYNSIKGEKSNYRVVHNADYFHALKKYRFMYAGEYYRVFKMHSFDHNIIIHKVFYKFLKRQLRRDSLLYKENKQAKEKIAHSHL